MSRFREARGERSLDSLLKNLFTWRWHVAAAEQFAEKLTSVVLAFSSG
jgi:hypothetical protein